VIKNDSTNQKLPPETRKMIDRRMWVYSFNSPLGLIPPCFPQNPPSDRYCDIFGYVRRSYR